MRTPTAARVTAADFEALAGFRYVLRQFLRFSEEAARSVGLTARQHQALLAVKGFPGRDRVTIGELAERLQIRHHSAVGLVDRLVAQGLAARAPGGGDRRRVSVRLTRAGSGLLRRLAAAHAEELRRVGPRLSRLLVSLAGGGDRGPGSGSPAGPRRSRRERERRRPSARRPSRRWPRRG